VRIQCPGDAHLTLVVAGEFLDDGSHLFAWSTPRGPVVHHHRYRRKQHLVGEGRLGHIDNGPVVAWDSRLHYEISVTTGNSRGLIGNLVNSVTSGEAVVLKFSGNGKVILSSRNPTSFRAWAKA